jgi:putative ABC transport system permease protein
MRGTQPLDDLDSDIRDHIDRETRDNVERGMSPDDARHAALRRFGNVTRAREDTRAIWIPVWLDQLRQDIHVSIRSIARTPRFAVIAVVTLALGIGANTAIFSVVHSVLVKPLPFRDSDRVVHIVEHIPSVMRFDGLPGRSDHIYANDYLAWQTHTRTLSHLAAYDRDVAMTFGADEPARIVGAVVTPSLFPLLGVPPLMGHSFTEADGDRSVVISHGLWHSTFAAHPSVLGRTVTLDGNEYRVVAVMPEGFAFPTPAPAFWVPLNVRRTDAGEITDHQFIARLRDGIAIDAATAEAQRILKGIRGHIWRDAPLGGKATIEVLPVKDSLVAPVRRALLLLLTGVGFVLLIACGNVANLSLARHTAHQHEAAIRMALGAGRGRLMRQLLTESALLGLMGCVGGLVIAYGSVHFLAVLGPGDLPRLDEISIDRTVLGFAVGLSIVSGLLVGILPALRVSRRSAAYAVRSSAPSITSSSVKTRSLLVAVEVAMATMLLVGGGLLIRSFVKLASVDPGFDTSNLLVFQVALPQQNAARASAAAMTDTFRAQLEALPAVRQVAISNQLPFRRRNGTMPNITGLPIPITGAVDVRIVSRNYPSVMGLRVLEGRSFHDGDGEGQPFVILVNETVARHFGGVSPLGKSLTVAKQPAEIVGVVNDTRESALDREPRPQVYIDARQIALRSMHESRGLAWALFAVRTTGSPQAVIADVRRLLQQLAPRAALELNVGGMDAIISSSVAQRRFYAIALGIFAVLAVALAAIGVYGVMTYAVVQRTHEIGIRMALGARRSTVMALVLRQSMAVTAVGLTAGIAGAVGVTRYLEGMLFGVTPLDKLTFVAVAVTFAAVAALASYLPAQRATQIDPLIALKAD